MLTYLEKLLSYHFWKFSMNDHTKRMKVEKWWTIMLDRNNNMNNVPHCTLDVFMEVYVYITSLASWMS